MVGAMRQGFKGGFREFQAKNWIDVYETIEQFEHDKLATSTQPIKSKGRLRNEYPADAKVDA